MILPTTNLPDQKTVVLILNHKTLSKHVLADQYWTGKYFSHIGDIDEMRHYHHMYLFDTSRSDPPVSGNLTLTSNGKSFTMTFPASAAEVKSTMKNVFKVNFDFKVEKSGDCDEGFQYVVTALEPGVLPKLEFDLQTTGIFKPKKIHPSFG